jgi:hypothetical protein
MSAGTTLVAMARFLTQRLREPLKDLVFVDMQLAADAFNNSPSAFPPEEIPPCRPPFTNAVFAWCLTRMNIGGVWETPPVPVNHAVLMRSRVLEDGSTGCNLAAFVMSPDGLQFMAETGDIISPSGHIDTGVRPAQVGEWLKRHLVDRGDLSEQQKFDAVYGFTAPVLYAMGVMNCANVKFHEQVVSRPVRRRLGFHLVIKTLVVTGSMKRPAREDEPTGNHPGVARHYCRGHFRDYTQGAGLFGKYHGTYWTPPTWKGSAEQGVVHKSYSVAVPS